VVVAARFLVDAADRVAGLGGLWTLGKATSGFPEERQRAGIVVCIPVPDRDGEEGAWRKRVVRVLARKLSTGVFGGVPGAQRAFCLCARPEGPRVFRRGEIACQREGHLLARSGRIAFAEEKLRLAEWIDGPHVGVFRPHSFDETARPAVRQMTRTGPAHVRG